MADIEKNADERLRERQAQEIATGNAASELHENHKRTEHTKHEGDPPPPVAAPEHHAHDDRHHHNHEHHEHRDPLTGAPGSHPLGTGVGAVGAGAAGAAIGAAAGPLGAIAGAAVGAVVGGLIGKGVAEGIDPTEERAFWRETYKDRPYYDQGFSYDTDYEPAYRYGWETRGHFHDRKFEDVEPHLEENWHQAKGDSRLRWEHAKQAVRDSWHRIEQRQHKK